MNRFLICLIILCGLSCKNQTPAPVPMSLTTSEGIPKLLSEVYVYDRPTTEVLPYNMKLRVEQLEDETYQLAIDMILENGAHYISPHSPGNYTGKFLLDIDPGKHIQLDKELTENPRSKEEFDSHPFVNGRVNWVRTNTTYTKKFKINNTENFKVPGLIKFTIEPRCTLEQIPFTLFHKDGKLQVIVEAGGC